MRLISGIMIAVVLMVGQHAPSHQRMETVNTSISMQTVVGFSCPPWFAWFCNW